MKSTETVQIEQHIQKIQGLYREWLAVQERLEQAKKDLQQSQELMIELEQFYFEGKYRDYMDALDNGLQVDLTTQGEYSVMSEDALWNAFHEQQQMLWWYLRFAAKHLDKDADE